MIIRAVPKKVKTKGKRTGGRLILFRVQGRFLKSRNAQAPIEVCDVRAKSLTIAVRRAIMDIMRRPTVKRLRHKEVHFSVAIRC